MGAETLRKIQGVYLIYIGSNLVCQLYIEELTETVLSAFRIPKVPPIGLSQRYDLQRELSRIILSYI